MKVRFHADYDHRWPSRAMTAFKAGFEGRVKREVGEHAIAKGKATLIDDGDIVPPHASRDPGRAGNVGGADRRPTSARRPRGNGGRRRGNAAADDHASAGDQPMGDAA